jgi:adenylate cyclase
VVKRRFVTREVDKIRVKGNNHPVTIYELLAPLAEQHRYESLLTGYNAAPDCYRIHNWLKAAGKFGQIMPKDLLDGVTQVLLQRCLDFIDDPPPDELELSTYHEVEVESERLDSR